MSTRTLVPLALFLGAMACGSGDASSLGETTNGQQPPGGSGGSGQAGGAGHYGGSGQAQGGAAGGPVSPPAPKAASVAIGKSHTCARLVGGAMKCWGDNMFGQLGLGDTKRRGNEPGEMGAALPAIDLGTGARVIGVAAREGRSCALLASNQVKCWGWRFGASQELLDGNLVGEEPGEMGDALPAVSLGAEVAAAVSMSDQVGYALTAKGQMLVWANSVEGDYGKPASSVDMGGALSLITGTPSGVFVDGTVRFWSETGYSSLVESVMTLNLGSGLTAISADGNSYYGCAVVNGGRVKCWGTNLYGQLGLGDLIDRSLDSQQGDALPYVDLGTGVIATRVVSSFHHSCALLADGRVKCWGDNAFGQLGLGDTTSRGGDSKHMGDNLPYVDLGAGVRAVDLVTNSDHSCAVLSDGRLKCWGGNGRGQLGLGDQTSRGNNPGQMGDALPFVDLGGLVEL